MATNSGRTVNLPVQTLRNNFDWSFSALDAFIKSRKSTDVEGEQPVVAKHVESLICACRAALAPLILSLRSKGISEECVNLERKLVQLITIANHAIPQTKSNGEDVAASALGAAGSLHSVRSRHSARSRHSENVHSERSRNSAKSAGSRLSERERRELQLKIDSGKVKLKTQEEIEKITTQQRAIQTRINNEKQQQKELEEKKRILREQQRIDILQCQLDIDNISESSSFSASGSSMRKSDIERWLLGRSRDIQRQQDVQRGGLSLDRLSIGSEPVNEGASGANGPSEAASRIPFTFNAKASSFRPKARESLGAAPRRPDTGSHLDAATRFLLVADLKKRPSDPFAGEPPHYNRWIATLRHKMSSLDLGPLDVLEILEAHTEGEPRELVRTLGTLVTTSPETAVDNIFLQLRRRFGRDSEVAHSVLNKLHVFPPIKGSEGDQQVAHRLRQFGDICFEANIHVNCNPDLQILNLAAGLEQLREKLPTFANNRWRKVKSQYTRSFNEHPPFAVFYDFVREMADLLCEDCKHPLSASREYGRVQPPLIRTLVTESGGVVCDDKPFRCALHKVHGHDTSKCFAFSKMSFKEKRDFASRNELCFRCLGQHMAANCKTEVQCETCGGSNHITVLHNEKKVITYSRTAKPEKSVTVPISGNATVTENPAGEVQQQADSDQELRTFCTEVCQNMTGRSCGKTLLVHVTDPTTKKVFKTYAIVDEQSNQTFGTSELFDFFNVDTPRSQYYITTLSGHRTLVNGRISKGLTVQGIHESRAFHLPPIFENQMIPDTTNEVATRSMLQEHPTLSSYASRYHELDEAACVSLLIGRDGGDLLASRCYGAHAPFPHETPLRWAVVGVICPMELSASTSNFVTMKTAASLHHSHFSAAMNFPTDEYKGIFRKRADDEMEGDSVDDKNFHNIMENNIRINSLGNIEVPLPLRDTNVAMPDNKNTVFRRQIATLQKLRREPVKLEQCLSAMEKNLTAGHMEAVPPQELDPKGSKTWFIPIFSVTNQKKGKVRLVFDSAATYHGVSLNSVLLQGPDYNNTLRGVLLRFREREVCFVADVEQMFHSFHVFPQHRDLMRFFWYTNNDPACGLTQYRSRVHIFGNKSSPAVSIMCLRYAAGARSGKWKREGEDFADEAKNYIRSNFYVDDGLGCADTPVQAIGILRTAKAILSAHNVRLHKISSSHREVLNAFPDSELADDVSELELDSSPVTKRTLGVAWSVEQDIFIVKVDLEPRPFTKRGMLSVVNSIFDPIGIASPVILGGRLIQRRVFSSETGPSDQIQQYGWDDPLPRDYMEEWLTWLRSLESLRMLSIPRCFRPTGFGAEFVQTLHVYSDASQLAIGHVVYLQSINVEGEVYVSFLRGESKVAPRAAVSIPRLELCAAAEAVLSVQEIECELAIKPNATTFYTDSKIVLGYIRNETRRFSRYVTRRVQMIHRTSRPDQWKYVSTERNPADMASRCQGPDTLSESDWLKGPSVLWSIDHGESPDVTIEPCELPELETSPLATRTLATHQSTKEGLFRRLFELGKSWRFCVSVCRRVLYFTRKALHKMKESSDMPFVVEAEIISDETATVVLLKDAQRESFHTGISAAGELILSPRDRLDRYAPFLDQDGLIRVGGRLSRSDMPWFVKHPIVIPANSPISRTLLTYYHLRSAHQGRHITLGAIRTAGYHLQGGRREVRNFLQNCIICRRLRAKCETQQMADLPSDRLEATAPFTNTGLDVFGHWLVKEGHNTRRSSALHKTWAVIFTCLSSRAVHIEPLPSLDTSTFINALRRFFAVRGSCKIIRSDRGSNFVGATNQSDKLDLEKIQSSFIGDGCRWIFNPPHASHFGGVWERKIGQLRRALDAALLQLGSRNLMRDELHTLLQEAAAVVNGTPLWAVSDDPNDPQPLTPAMLLNLKCHSDGGTNDYDAQDILSYGSRRWRRVQHLANQFWTHWRKFYLQELQERQKWVTKSESLRAGDVVILKEKSASRQRWPLCIVDSVKKSEDGLVRSILLRLCKATDKGTMKSHLLERPISEVVLLIRSKPE